jgi:phage-related protein
MGIATEVTYYVARMSAAYLDTADWADGPEAMADAEGTEAEECHGWHREAMAEADRICGAFYLANADDLEGADPRQAGHDLWLTRNGHGAGFWDGGWPDEAGERLADAARELGESSVYVGDDGWQYLG